jgi:hypothetical protein
MPAIAGAIQPGGGCTCTMLAHLGHERICPTSAASRTASRQPHVSHPIENSFSVTVDLAAKAMEMTRTARQ